MRADRHAAVDGGQGLDAHGGMEMRAGEDRRGRCHAHARREPDGEAVCRRMGRGPQRGGCGRGRGRGADCGLFADDAVVADDHRPFVGVDAGARVDDCARADGDGMRAVEDGCVGDCGGWVCGDRGARGGRRRWGGGLRGGGGAGVVRGRGFEVLALSGIHFVRAGVQCGLLLCGKLCRG